jgi:membrane protein
MEFAYFRPPVPWVDIVRRTAYEIGDDHCVGLAAQLAFYFLLALFPAVLFLVALVSYLPVDTALSELLPALGAVAPQELVAILRGQLDEISGGSHGSLLTLGIVGAIWSSSSAMVAIIDALNHAYDVTEWRPWWKRRFLAIVLTVALAIFTSIALALVLIGPAVASRAAAWFGLAPAVVLIWQLIRWPVMIVCAVLAVDLVYHFAPNRVARWAWVTPGALVATAAWIASSFGFRVYLANFGHYSATYGAIGGAIVTMLWFYVCSMAILIGAEVNGSIEYAWRSVPDRTTDESHRSPAGQATGERHLDS